MKYCVTVQPKLSFFLFNKNPPHFKRKHRFVLKHQPEIIFFLDFLGNCSSKGIFLKPTSRIFSFLNSALFFCGKKEKICFLTCSTFSFQTWSQDMPYCTCIELLFSVGDFPISSTQLMQLMAIRRVFFFLLSPKKTS